MAPLIPEMDLSHIHNKAIFMLSQNGYQMLSVGGWEQKKDLSSYGVKKFKQTEKYTQENAYKSEVVLRLLSLYLGSGEKVER